MGIAEDNKILNHLQSWSNSESLIYSDLGMSNY